MKKKQFTCRINNASYTFLEEFSKEMEVKHPVYEGVPNISKSLEIVISVMIDIKNENPKGFNWDEVKERAMYGER